MADISVQKQLDEINSKMDFLLEYVERDRLKRQEMDDLVADLSIVGKDVFTSTIVELDKAGVELNSEDLTGLLIRLVRNLDNFNTLFDVLESGIDLAKDVTPILQQVGLDTIHQMGTLEEKGYFVFINGLIKIVDKVISHFGEEDLQLLEDNVVTILEIVKNMTQPDMLLAMNNALEIYKNLDTKNIPQYSWWKLFRTINSPEMKRGIGFVMTFLQKLSAEQTENNK